MSDKKHHAWCAKCALVIASALAATLVAEVAIRIGDAANAGGFFAEPRNRVRRPPRPPRPFRTFGVDYYTTIDGVRHISSRHRELYALPKPENTFRIVTLGGSSTEDLTAFREAKVHYPLLLEKKLRQTFDRPNIEVINVGHSAYSTAHSLIVLQLDVLSWQPDMIIVCHNVNDLYAAYWPEFTFDYSNKYSNRFYMRPDVDSLYTPTNILFQRVQLYWVVKRRIERRRGPPPTTALRRRSYGNIPPREACDVYERNLRSIVALAKANGIQVLIGSQPLQPSEEFFLRHMAPKPYNSIVIYPWHEEFVKHHRHFNEIAATVARDTGVLFLDNDRWLDGEQAFFVDYVHYTPKGSARLAQNVHTFIVDRRLIE